MTVEVVLETPLAQALNTAIQPKLIEIGWSAGDDATALSEYIILMLVNGKNQQQIASELAGDLLQLGPDDPGAWDFAQWLFEQIEILDKRLNGKGQEALAEDDIANQAGHITSTSNQDTDMGEQNDINGHVPTGPKSMRNGNLRGTGRDKRIMNHISKAMDRSHDSVLHRVRPQVGNERIGRGALIGPRQQSSIPNRGVLRSPNGRTNTVPGLKGASYTPHGGPATNMMKMGPQQQIELYAILEKQSRMMAQLIEAQRQMGRGSPSPMVGGEFHPQQQYNGRSLFERAQHQSQGISSSMPSEGAKIFPSDELMEDASTAMDVDMFKEKKDLDPEITACKFNLSCTNKECKFAHQSPAAPIGANIDFKDKCTFGAACKNRKCTGKHPSPAQKIAHQTELDCRFFPKCTNLRCPFRHPTMPLCRNGAECEASDCKFTHLKTMCKFNPCLNPSCTFKHIEGQKRGKFEDKVWTAGSAKEHVSERKFVHDHGPEELIVPGTSDSGEVDRIQT
ncbi:hypothetical protein GcM1_250233 [Golovinomyces cichoracearum]|uniref:Nab2-like CCCH zinc finger domain-containing protein n=1 Tax=Golovinomyces cichoracearum TaxID=62708 RepID=A0A420IB95_9PEZI|nr:hypothetical protein GcM1_250233 [Golovinomyces cichoracearum]